MSSDEAVDGAFTTAALKGAGFQGFVPMRALRSAPSVIPQTRGVYVLIREAAERPVFLERGTGGFFRGRDPNVPVEVLRQNWVADAAVLSIGKAGDPGRGATLRTRVWQYLRFGVGANVGHWGGRYVWQLEDAEDLSVAWITLPDAVPSVFETTMINAFRLQHLARPFANLAK